jgi:hypothetical protein
MNFGLHFTGPVATKVHCAKRLSATLIHLIELMFSPFVAAIVFLFISTCAHAVSPVPKYSANNGKAVGNLYDSVTAACTDWTPYSNATPASYNWVFAGAVLTGPNQWECLALLVPTAENPTGTTHGPSATFPATMELLCPPGYPPYDNQCGQPPISIPDPNTNKGDCSCDAGANPINSLVGNPINALVGNKVQKELDYRGTGPFPIVLERFYNSFGAAPGAPLGLVAASSGSTAWIPFNPVANPDGNIPTSPIVIGNYSNASIDFGWRLSYDRALTTSSGSTNTATLFRADSKTRTFTQTNGVWTPTPGQLVTALTQQMDGSGNTLGFTYINENEETESYDPNGRLLSIANRAGLTQTLQYNNVFNTLSPNVS